MKSNWLDKAVTAMAVIVAVLLALVIVGEIFTLAAEAQVPDSVLEKLPKVYMLGGQDAACLRAAEKALYIESRVGFVPGHIVYVHCTLESYTEAIQKLGISFAQSPDGTSLLKTRITHFNAASVLRTQADYRHKGDFLVAHEIGHFAMDTGQEWQADAWAAQALKKYVKVSYEDFRK
jgi:hypothetical protein